jgi:GDP-L-fucose synthase
MSKKILITGGSGMVGKHLQKLIPDGIFLSSKDGDLTDYAYTQWVISSHSPDIIIHLAAKVGGIKDNIAYPSDYINDNLLINTNILKACIKYNIKHFIGILSTCAYPDVVSNYPMTEEDLFLSAPSKSNLGYGYSKRCLALQIDACNKQYGTSYNYIIPCNLYSEYDNFENENKMHFITALLNKIKNNKGEQIKFYGTGKALRQFMYADDLAKIIKYIIDNNITDSFNVAYPENLSIDEMINKTLKVLNLDIDFVYLNDGLDGQLRKDVSIDKMKSIIPNFNFTLFEEGIKLVYNKIK